LNNWALVGLDKCELYNYISLILHEAFMQKLIDINFDFQAEAEYRDSDKHSPTLQEYHRILWSKPLPNGKHFELKKISQNRLYHKSELGEFFLSSDRAIASFSKYKRFSNILSQVPEAKTHKFYQLSDTIGGILVWPSNRINKKMTINGARGFNSKIADRFDLTIECVRCHYLNLDSPLSKTFKIYTDFFALFDNFRGFIDFFLLQDIVSDNYSIVKIATDFNDFNSSPIPNSVEEYLTYMDNTTKFIEARNSRIDSWANRQSQ